jgi:catechol 2,3-dioxygenase-like lactoylglutathione lyase family enzyme
MQGGEDEEGDVDLGPIVEATVASRDIGQAVTFYAEVFGWDVLEDAGAAVVIGVPGVSGPRVRLIEAPDDPGFGDPRICEIGPRILGIRTRDLGQSRALFETVGTPGATGGSLSYTSGFVGLGIDDVFYSVEYWEEPLFAAPALDGAPDRLHSELHSVGIVVPDLSAGRDFFVIGGGLIAQAYAEDLIGQHPAAARVRHDAPLGTAILSDESWSTAVLELLQFDADDALERHERTVGIKRVTYAVPSESIESFVADLLEEGAEGIGPSVLRGPAGIEIELRTP